MTVLKRIFLVTILIICISFSFCYAIDENQLSQNSNQPSTTTGNSQTLVEENNQSYETNNAQTDNTYGESSENTSVQETTNNASTSRTENQSSTIVSNVSSSSKTSTVTNILNIALLVVGILLIFLAIAILIRLNT